MKIENLPGMLLIKPDVYDDPRGYFYETWNSSVHPTLMGKRNFVQSNRSISRRNVIRGLHSRKYRKEFKLLTIFEGDVLDVVVNELTGENYTRIFSVHKMEQLLILPGWFHGFQVISEVADIEYKTTELYDPNDEIGIRYDDPEIGVKWLKSSKPFILSDKDKKLPTLAELRAK